jgi:alkylation response protein AidB-like acyl-CoA dehydrogenase
MATVVSVIAAELAGAFTELLASRLGQVLPSDEFFASDHSEMWAEIAAGGWVDLAAPAESNGGELTWRDLTAFAETWGRYLIPLPFSATVALRKSADVRAVADAAAPLTLSVPGTAEENLVPFQGGEAQVGHVCWRDTAAPEVGELPSALRTDVFAPSLPLGITLWPASTEPEILSALSALWAAEAAGAAAAAFDAAFRYGGLRHAFGRPIAEFQAVKHRVADMYRSLELARTAALWAANVPADAERAVTLALELAREVIEGAIQIEGGMGFTWEAGIHFYLRHVLALDRIARPAARHGAAALTTRG